MSLFAKSVFGYDMSLETDLTENYYNTINDAMEESQLLTENYSLSREVLQEGVMDSIKNFFSKAWEGIKKFFNYIIKKVGDFINYIKSLFSKKKNEKNDEGSDNKKEDDGKKSINEPAPGVPVKMEVKKAEEAVVAAKQEVSKAKTPEAKKAAEKKVEQAKAKLENVKKEANTAKSSYKQDQKHDYQVNQNSLKNHANVNTTVSPDQKRNQITVGEKHFVVKNYLDMDKFDYKGAVGKLNKLNFEAMSLLTRRVQGEKVEIHKEFTRRVKKEVAEFISDIESKVVDEQEIVISINHINEYLKKLTAYKEAGEFCKSIIDKYDGNVQEIIKKGLESNGGTGSHDVPWYANIIKRVLITPFNKLANLISHSSTALGQQIVKFLNPNAKPVGEE